MDLTREPARLADLEKSLQLIIDHTLTGIELKREIE
jgi:hypothetical protein